MTTAERTPYFRATSAAPHLPSRTPSSTTPESAHFRSFTNSTLATSLVYPITSLAFSPTHLAASVSASLLLFSSPSLSPTSFSPVSRFPDVSYSPSFRPDANLLAVGDHTGQIQLFDPNRNRPPLRSFKNHTRPVRVVRYADNTHFFSGADDAVVSYWDTSLTDPVVVVPGAHRDYVRAGAVSPVSSEVFVSGGYDHAVKMWDMRGGSVPVMEWNHGFPVESVVFLPSGGLVATAGGNCVKIWDVIGGGRLIHSMERHNKTVTCLCVGKLGKKGVEESRIFSVSIDGYMKVLDYSSFKVTHSMRYQSMLLSVAASPDGLVRAVGTSNGVIYVSKKEKKEKMDVDELVGRGRKSKSKNFRYFHRGQGEKVEEDYVVEKPRKVKLAEYDKLLKKFRHKDALVSALNNKNPGAIMAVIEELVARKKLMLCVENLDLNELGLLLSFLHKYVTLPKYARYLMGLAKKVVQMRFDDIQKSDELKHHIRNIKRVVAEEIQLQQQLQEIQGMLSPLIKMAGR